MRLYENTSTQVDDRKNSSGGPAIRISDELRTASDQTIDSAIQHMDPMIARGLLYQLTGSTEIAATPITRVPSHALQIPAPADDDVADFIRRRAADFLKLLRDSGVTEIDSGPASRIPTSLRLASGEDIPDDAIGLWSGELALDPFGRSLRWKERPPVDKLEAFPVVVIGAGIAGLNAALQLKRAGIPFTVIEKNPGPGGTWFENRYPGCRLDTPSRAYTHTVGVDFPYRYAFSPWTETKKYTEWFTSHFDLYEHIVFETEVLSMRWDESSSEWAVVTSGPQGEQVLRARGVISAVGFLNRPSIPEIVGQDDFAGTAWHTARWPHGADLTGKRVAVVGTGCTGYQLIPELAPMVKELVIFQRTPQWLFDTRGYLSPLPNEVTWLERNFPYYTNFLRFRELHFFESSPELTKIDPDFDDPYTRSAINKRMRDVCIDFLERKLNDPDLVAKMTPRHPPRSARAVLVDPENSVLDALLRDNVTLVTDGIKSMDRTGIQAGDGTHWDVDAIVYATGFHATEYLYPMTVIGREGVELAEFWREGGARSHRFSMVPGFPNFWMLYGPNTNGGLQPAAFDELVTLYALQCMERLLGEEKSHIEPKLDAYWRFNTHVDEVNATRLWSDSRARNYYWTEHGRSSVMCPFSGREVWHYLRKPDFNELEIR